MSAYKETHVINGAVVTGTHLDEHLELDEFIEGIPVTGDLLDWVDSLNIGSWLVRRGTQLINLEDEVYCELFGKVVRDVNAT